MIASLALCCGRMAFFLDVVRTTVVRSLFTQQARDTLTNQRAGVASRRVALLAQRCTRNETDHTHTHITARATHTPLAGAERLVQMYLRATVSTHACDAAARTQRGASSRSRVGAASGGVGARQAALRAQHKQDRRARATSYSQKNKHSHNHAIHRQMCGVTESRSFFQSRAR
jgi:hypothetical protein